jgi:VanZ family protein
MKMVRAPTPERMDAIMEPRNSSSGHRMRMIVAAVIALLVSITILLAGLWPLQFHPENHARWIPGDSGIRFGRLGMVYSKQPVYGSQLALQPGQPMSIELAIRPAAEPSNGIGNILTIFDESGHDVLLLGQWKNHFILRTSVNGDAGILSYRETGVDNVLQMNVLRHLCAVFQPNGVAIYIDGQPAHFSHRFPVPPQGKGGTANLILGNSPDGKNSWKGDFFFLSFYGGTLTPEEVSRLHLARSGGSDVPEELPAPPVLSYSFDEHIGTIARNREDSHYDLSIPPEFHMPIKTFLVPPWKEHPRLLPYLKDVIVNVLGFIPFGFFCMALFHREAQPSSTAAIGVEMLGLGVSLAIELTQAYLPTRSSSLMDVFSNLLGTVIGILLFRRTLHFFNRTLALRSQIAISKR